MIGASTNFSKNLDTPPPNLWSKIYTSGCTHHVPKFFSHNKVIYKDQSVRKLGPDRRVYIFFKNPSKPFTIEGGESHKPSKSFMIEGWEGWKSWKSLIIEVCVAENLQNHQDWRLWRSKIFKILHNWSLCCWKPSKTFKLKVITFAQV